MRRMMALRGLTGCLLVPMTSLVLAQAPDPAPATATSGAASNSGATVSASTASTGSTGSNNAPQSPPSAQPAARGPSLKVALVAAQKALETCKGLEQKVGVTVVDSAGVPKVVLATDGASPRGVASSTNKALTALAFGAATSDLGERAKTDADLAAKVAANASYNTRAGGVLLRVGDQVIGAIGVGGAKGSEKDEACALAGVQKVRSRLK